MMIYIILVILVALVYLFLMPSDIRRSMDIFVFVGLGVLIVSLGISQAALNQNLLLEILMFIGAIILMVRAWIEIGGMNKNRANKNRRTNSSGQNRRRQRH